MFVYKLGTVALLLCFAFTANLASAKTLRLSESEAEGTPTVVAMHRFGKLLEEKTNGNLKVHVFAGGQLGSEASTISQTQQAVISLSRVNSVALSNVDKLMKAFTLPYIFPNNKKEFEILDSAIGKEVSSKLKDVGLINLGYLKSGTRNFYCRKPVDSLKSLKNKKIRVQPAPIPIKMVKLIGGVPTPMPYGQVYSALQKGVIDCAENNFVSYLTTSHYKAAPYVLEDQHMSPPGVLIMNKNTFNQLTKKQQRAVRQSANEAINLERTKMLQAQTDARKKLLNKGVTISQANKEKFRAAVKPIYSNFPKLKHIISEIRNYNK